MRICFVSKEKIPTFRLTESEKSSDVYLFGFQGNEEISYTRELTGETEFFSAVAKLSKACKGVVVCGCVTNIYGHKRKSAIVAENGKIYGISDALYSVESRYACGASLRVYDTKAGRMGVIVDEDLYFPDTAKALATCGSDFIVCPFKGALNGLPSVLLRAWAYTYGVPILCSGDGYAMIADHKGETVFASPQSSIVAELDLQKEYHLVETRRCGFYPSRSDEK